MRYGHAFSVLLTYFMLSFAVQAQTPVEVTLVDRLDEARGFCFDTLGFQTRARPEEGLQTHSCYSYQGQLAVDQSFDADMIADGTFRTLNYLMEQDKERDRDYESSYENSGPPHESDVDSWDRAEGFYR